ncbi:MAG: hypothetical protein CL849_05460 [Crocinitomicaceae bacterium]|nr:hypothetical protein [Crocinitomicaceae bacterium]
MRVLQLCHKPPKPSVDGGCLAMDAMTLGFLENGADVKVLTAATRKHPILMDKLDQTYLDSTDLEAVRIETQLDIRDAYIALMNGDSYNISRFYAHHYAMVVKRTLSRKRYDVVHLESLYTTPYIETIRRHAPNALISLRSHNHEYQIWEQRWKASRNPFHRLALRHLSKTLERYEKDVLNNVDVLVAISENEAKGYRDWGYSGPIHVAGFGIDMSARISNSHGNDNSKDRPIRLFHLGAMDWGPNREGIAWFIDSVWPELVKRHPGTEFHLAGKSLPPDLHAGVEGIVNHGEVADADLFASQYDMLVVPLLRGAGIRVKIVEALAKGIPVATTKMGVAGLDLENRDCIICGEPDQLCELISDAIGNQSNLQMLSLNSRQIAIDRFDRKTIGKDLLEFYRGHVQT